MEQSRNLRNFAWVMGLSVALGVALYATLIYYGGPWNFIANTRLLDLAIGAGLIKYHDHNAGFIDGVADLKYYLMAQEPIRWDLLGVVVLIFLAFYAIKAVQFNGLARVFGSKADTASNVRAYSYGVWLNHFFPYGLGYAGTSTALQEEGMPLERAKATAFTARLFVLFEIAVFAVIGLFLVGWNTWFAQIFWALVILAIAFFFMRGVRNWRGQLLTSETKERFGASLRALGERPGQSLWLGFLSLLAFGLEDIAAYFTAMAFTTSVVVLKVEFSVLLMAVVASYIARLIRITPGGLGQFEWAFAAALYVGGLGFPECVTIAVLDNFFRYIGAGIFLFLTGRRAQQKVHFARVLSIFSRREGEAEPSDPSGASVAEGATTHVPNVPLEQAPAARTQWGRALIAAAVVAAVFYIDQLTFLFFDFWLLESLNLESMFWTNFQAGLWLFLFGLVTMGGGIAAPAFIYKLPSAQKRFVLGTAVLVGSLGGYFLSLTYQDFLLAFSDGSFGKEDPIFGKDLGFYVFSLPAIWVALEALIAGMALGLVSALGCGWAHLHNQDEDLATRSGLSQARFLVGYVFGSPALIPLALLGVLLAIAEWFTRYGLLLQSDEEAPVRVGASYIDVEGFFSNVNYIWITTLVILGLTAIAVTYFKNLHDAATGEAAGNVGGKLRKYRNWALILIALDFGFKAAVSVRDWIQVKPNEPVIQLKNIEYHVQATRDAYGLDRIETVEFTPKYEGDPVPSAEELLASSTLKSAPLWPGFSSYLERFIDPQHSKRILQTGGDKMVYGPSLEIFRQQQKLRTYYDILGVDWVRYNLDGEKKMFVSAVRELPLIEPVPWLAWFGQRFMLFTHGWGMVMAETSEIENEGDPVFIARNIPTQLKYPELAVENERVYYGEGSATMAYSNVDRMKEFDYPTDQERAELTLGDQVSGAVAVDSLLKRFAYGWRSGQIMELLFSDLITDETRVHFYRTPLNRLREIAPFLYYDTNPYAVVADGKIMWMVNGMTTTDNYPYSQYEQLGDKSDERSYDKLGTHDLRIVNYVEDSVKATVDAFDGSVRFYKISNGPVVEAWSNVYPDLFTEKKEMPQSIASQMTYPVHLMHIQFDDVYIYYHMKDPMYFFNLEDMWDDGDEVLGPILDSGHAIRFSIEPYTFLLDTKPAEIPTAVGEDKVQFAQAMVFTPEKALNLRAIPMVYQDGEDYGRLVVLQVPKGYYYPGPEQADSTIDQNPDISEQISWWNRKGTDVIRGHTSALVIGDEVIYVEPIFIRSQQNPVTQLRRVVAVFRGVARMGETLEEALRLAIAAFEEPGRGAPPWAGDDPEEVPEGMGRQGPPRY